VTTEGDRQARVRFHHPTAGRVELAGDFTDWRPIPLVRVLAGVWEARIDLRPGLYLVNLSVDGGAFEVPPGMDRTDDGFGGQAGVLVVR
jgi:hypothetical protein